MCAMANCYRLKASHVFHQHAVEMGVDVLAVDDAAEIFSGSGGTVHPSADWIDLGEEVPARDVGHYGSVRWRKWIEDELGEKIEAVAKVYLALHPATYETRVLVGKAAVRMLLKTAAKTKGPEETKPTVDPEAGDDGGDVEPTDAEDGAMGGAMPGTVPESLNVEEAAIYRGLFETTV